MDTKKLKKQKEVASKLSKPKPIMLPSGAWRCQVMVKGRRIDVIEDDPALAHAKALAIKEGLVEEDKPVSSMTVGEAIDKYIESKDAVLSPSTVREYKRARKNDLPGLVEIKLSDLTQDMVQREMNRIAKEKSPKSVRNAHGLLSAAIKAYKPEMVLRTTLPQKEKKEIKIPTVDEIKLIADKSKGTRFELPFYLAAWMGLRESEIRGLTWDCIEGEMLHVKQAIVEGENGPAVKTTKTYSGNRKIRIPAYIKGLLEEQKRTDEYIVHYTGAAMYSHLKRLCAREGLPHYRFHDLRHFQASVMLALGVPDKYAMERMGHASTNMLKTVYQHTMKSKTEEVADTVDKYFEENLHTSLHTENEECR